MNQRKKLEMDMVRYVLIVAVSLLLSANSVFAQKPPMSLAERIELATKLIAEDREAAIKNPTDSKRTWVFTEASAMVDPQWTADFIISNPIDGQANAAHENKAIRRLLSRPELLTSEQVTKLASFYPFLSSSYIQLALDNLPKDAKYEPLKDQLIAMTLKKFKEAEPAELVFGMSLYSKEHLKANPEVAAVVEKKVAEFFTSGKAKKAWKKLSRNDRRGNGNAFQKTRLKRMAPEGFDLSFLGETEASTVTESFEVAQVLEDRTLSDKEKKAWLDGKTEFRFETKYDGSHFSVLRLGRVADFDLPKAIQWAESAKSPVTEILGKLSIAPVLARTDKPAAIKLVRECYDMCLTINLKAPKNRGDMILLNTHPIKMATSGLKIAGHIDPELLADCVKDTLELVERDLKPTQEYARMGRVFRSLAGVARYDHKAAKAVFDGCAGEVQLHSAADFFIALAAIDPESVWEEYSTLPADGDAPRDPKPRFRVRQAIASALAEYEDDAFWTSLLGHFNIAWPESIFKK